MGADLTTPTAPDAAPSPPGGHRRGPPDLGPAVARLALVLLAALFVLGVAGDLNEPFGDSYDGRNGGVWGAGARALREQGPVDSALGARHESGLVYARHPPAIYPLTATAEVVLGERPIATRVPSLVAAVATLGLLYALGRTVGLRRATAMAGVVVGAGSAMLTVYGPMPDTPMLGLPLGLALVLAALRRAQGRPFDPRAEVVLAAAAALTAWQAVFIALVVAGVEAARAAPPSAGLQPRRRLRGAAPFLIGTGAGLTLTLLWVVWATGGPGHLVEALTERSGAQGGADGGGIVAAQLTALVDLFGVALLGLGATIAALRDHRYRLAAGLLLAAVFGYTLITPTAAAVHDYWLYWSIAPIAFGWSLVAEAVVAAVRPPARDLALGAVSLAAVALLVAGSTRTSAAGASMEAGIAAGRLVAEAPLPAEQDRLATVGVVNHLAAWIPYTTGRDTGGLADTAALAELAATEPDHLILASTWCPADDDGLCVAVTGGGGTRVDHDYLLLTARAAHGRAAS